MKKPVGVMVWLDPIADRELVKELIENNGCSVPGPGQSVYHGGNAIAKVIDVVCYTNDSAIPDADRDKYWRAVADCLVKFHGKTQDEAITLTAKHRAVIEDLDIGDIAYHEEPFYRANGLAGSNLELPIKDYQEKYLKDICGFACLQEGRTEE